MDNRLSPPLAALGLARKAGRVICGTPLVCSALGEKNPPSLVVMSAYASDNTRKRVRDRCAYYGVQLYELSESPAELARAIGSRGEVAAVAICDGGLARLFLSKAEKTTGEIRYRNEE